MDLEFYISVASSREATEWKNKKIKWSNFVELFREPVRTKETLTEYKLLVKAQQTVIKDVGGFVGGFLEKGRRKNNYIRERQLICLDLDSPRMGLLPHIPFTAIIHSTHKHEPDYPRYRIIIPLKEPISAIEYEYVARRISMLLGMYEEHADLTTYQAARMMFWPSCSADGEYIFREMDGEVFDGKDLLAQNPNWQKDFLNIPEKNFSKIEKEIKKKQADPRSKSGVIAAFCKAYSMIDTISKFIPKYEPTDQPDRYTWSEGSCAAGVLIFENLYSYSFHSTDPATMRLCNAYDLVRIHLFNGNEKDTLTWCAKQPGTANYLAQEAFAEDFEDWMMNLEYDHKGKLLCTIANMEVIINHHFSIKYNRMINNFEINGRPFENGDDGLIIAKIEKDYNIFAERKSKIAISTVGRSNAYHPVKDYLEGLSPWDGVERVDTLLIKCFSAADTIYNREVIRLTLLGALRRIYEPGCEFQHILALRGKQRLGKSTFYRKLAVKEEWFSDSLSLRDCGDTKKGGEQLQGSWILEIPEMKGMSDVRIQDIRSFITRQTDKFRPAYGNVSENFPRQSICVTTVNESYLHDIEGNRRHWTVMCNTEFRGVLDIDQIWAEVLWMYKNDYDFRLSPAAEKMAAKIEQENLAVDDRTGIIQQYINTPVPIDWMDKTLSDRLDYLGNEFVDPSKIDINDKYYIRETITTLEVWCECFNKMKADLTRKQSNAIIKSLIALGYSDKTYIYDKNYGKQVGYKKPAN